VRSTRLAVVPGWVGELTCREAMEIGGMIWDRPNPLLKTLPASLVQLRALALAWLHGPDAVVRLNSLVVKLTIEWCGKLKALPRQIGKLGHSGSSAFRG